MRTKKLIYVVDDQEGILNFMLAVLQTNPKWQGQVFSNPKDALNAVKTAPPDLILSDQCMPEMNGSELLELVRQVSPDTVRIIMSGDRDPAELSQIRAADHYIVKPFSTDQIKSLISSSLLLCKTESL